MNSALTLARTHAEEILSELRDLPSDIPEVETRKARAVKLASGLIEDIALAVEIPDDDVCWVENDPPVLRIAPIDVSDLLRIGVWDGRTAVLTSATIPSTLPTRLGLDDVTPIAVDSPFEFAEQALLYQQRTCPTHARTGGAARCTTS